MGRSLTLQRKRQILIGFDLVVRRDWLHGATMPLSNVDSGGLLEPSFEVGCGGKDTVLFWNGGHGGSQNGDCLAVGSNEETLGVSLVLLTRTVREGR